MQKNEEGWAIASAEKGGREECNECRKGRGDVSNECKNTKREGGAERAYEGKGGSDCSKTRMEKGQKVHKTREEENLENLTMNYNILFISLRVGGSTN